RLVTGRCPQLAASHIAHRGELRAIAKRIRIGIGVAVLAAQRNAVELARTVRTKQRKFEFRCAILAAEKQVERMFRECAAAALSATHPQTCIDLKSGAGVWLDQLQRR